MCLLTLLNMCISDASQWIPSRNVLKLTCFKQMALTCLVVGQTWAFFLKNLIFGKPAEFGKVSDGIGLPPSPNAFLAKIIKQKPRMNNSNAESTNRYSSKLIPPSLHHHQTILLLVYALRSPFWSPFLFQRGQSVHIRRAQAVIADAANLRNCNDHVVLPCIFFIFIFIIMMLWPMSQIVSKR